MACRVLQRAGAVSAAARAPPQRVSVLRLRNYVATASTAPTSRGAPLGSKSSLLFRLPDRPGALADALALFTAHGVNVTRIESRPARSASSGGSSAAPGAGSPPAPPAPSSAAAAPAPGGARAFEFAVDFDAPAPPAGLLAALERACTPSSVRAAPPVPVPWFPLSVAEVDLFSTKTLDAGAELEADHPGFHDAAYRARRRDIVAAAASYAHGAPLPRVAYTAVETETWRTVYTRLRETTRELAVEAYNRALPQMERECGYAPGNIPQLEDISGFLASRTGFTLRPVGGLLTARDFLNGLAFRVFFSTQYIRHASVPLYTPEPDVVHELLGHAPMFADPDFADFSQEIGLASLGASGEEVKKLATCYWFSVEFGLCRAEAPGDGLRAYGAGLLSSFGELEYAARWPPRAADVFAPRPAYAPWEPAVAAATPYPITKYQPLYFVADSLAHAKARMREYCEGRPRPFGVTWDAATKSVSVDRNVVREPYRGGA